jgi:hypothetical protein
VPWLSYRFLGEHSMLKLTGDPYWTWHEYAA